MISELHIDLLFTISFIFLSALQFCDCAILSNSSKVPQVPGMEIMASDKYPHFTMIERVSKSSYHRFRRQVIAGPIYEWTNYEIPFTIWGGDYNFQNLIRRGVRMWEEATCLRFRETNVARDGIRGITQSIMNRGRIARERTDISCTAPPNTKDSFACSPCRYVLEKGDSCFTEFIGRNGGFQDIIIGSECAEEYVVAHETGHALGFWHTHQRPDRDRYISVNWKNVLDEATASFMPFRSMLQAFGIEQISSRRTPYDYGSLMHYHAVAHAIKVSDFTIVPKELKYVTTMGTERMAFLDAKIINDIYCPKVCYGRQRLNCNAGGYPDPNNCNILSFVWKLIMADEIFQRADLNSLQQTNGKCFQVRLERTLIAIGEYRFAFQLMLLRVPQGSKIRFRLSDGEFPCSYGCQSYVEIKHKLDVRLTGFRRFSFVDKFILGFS
ncbi:unnamed protein product [Anisakis simplex]|uniref:Zinc metalloproteinase n=1 Tax=Anisakis simplex TaxID=6269 RepID=A0A0M3JRL7_ANISI|nr:unnamed protein product [Anisakis simplex]